MSKYTSNITTLGLLSSWLKKGLVTESNSSQLETFIISQQEKKDQPIYLQILTSICALIALFFFFLSLSHYGLHESIVMSFILIFLAIFLAKISGNKNSFLIQNSFYAMALGKIIFVMSFINTNNSDEDLIYSITSSTLIVTVMTYHLYKVSLDRFLSTLGVLMLLLIYIASQSSLTELMKEIILNLFFLIQIILAAVLFTDGRVKRDYMPLAYAIIFSLLIMVLYFTLSAPSLIQEPYHIITFINSLLAIVLIVLIGWASGDFKKLKTKPLIIASLGSILLGIISAPGIILSICLMVLGYAKDERLLQFTGMITMPIFIFLYYYNLDLSLMVKSGVLIGSGIILLIGHRYLISKKIGLIG